MVMICYKNVTEQYALCIYKLHTYYMCLSENRTPQNLIVYQNFPYHVRNIWWNVIVVLFYPGFKPLYVV